MLGPDAQNIGNITHFFEVNDMTVQKTFFLKSCFELLSDFGYEKKLYIISFM